MKSYDGLHRLTNMQRGNLAGNFPNYSGIDSATRNREQVQTLDQLGNWSEFKDRDTDVSTWDLDQDRTHNAVNEITDVTVWADPVYDMAGNMTTMPGALDVGDPWSLKYDAWNRLVEVRDSNPLLIAKYEYDGLNRRIVRSVYVSGSLDHRIHYYYNQRWQLLEERKEVSGTEDPDPLGQYVWHPYYIDALAVRYYDADTNGSQVRHWYLQDANYNVTAVVNDTGTVLERYHYTPYGEVTVLDADFSADANNSSDIGNTHLYTGRERDPETGLQLNRHRYYASHLGRWLTRDPVEYVGSFNLCEYVNGQPTSYFDPMGEIRDSVNETYKKCLKKWKKGELDEFCDCICIISPLKCERTCQKCAGAIRNGTIPELCYCLCTTYHKKPRAECVKKCGHDPNKPCP